MMSGPGFAEDEKKRDAVTMHAQECDLCPDDSPALAATVAILRASPAADWSSSSLPLLRAAVCRQARLLLCRRVAFALAVGSIPLPLVLAYDALVLRVGYDLIRQLLPVEVAAYVVFSYAALCLFLISLTYAAIPVLLAKAGRSPLSSPIGATS